LIPFFFCLHSQAQVTFFYNETHFVFNQQDAKIFIDSSVNRTIDRYRQIQEKMIPMAGQSVNLNYKNQMLWILLPIKGFGHRDELKDIMIRNPHINFLDAWFFKKDSLVQSFQMTGDHQPFSSRATEYPDYIFPLPNTDPEDLSILLLIDKRNEQLNIPIHGMSEKGISDYNRKKNLLAGLITGLSMFLFLFSLFLYYNMREKLYVFYGLYIVAAFAYIFSDYGYLFMYFFPNHPGLADFTRPIAISLATPLYMLFAIRLLNIKENLPKQYTWCIRYLMGYFSLFIIAMFFLPESGIIRVLLVLLMQVVQNLTALFILIIAIIGWRKKIPYAPYIIGSSSVLLVSFSFFMLFVSGLIPDNFFTRNLMNLGFSTELSILAFVLTLRFKNYKLQMEQLLRKVNIQQEQIYKSISDYQEKEMQRLSSLLHDSIGARLSTLRLNLETSQLEQLPDQAKHKIHSAITDISNLADEVRSFSHSLSPLLLQEKGLVKAIRQIVDRVNQSKGLFIQFENIGSRNQIPFRYELMMYNILQELIQNIIKHAGASEAIIQLILEKELISVFIEDNGVGFEKSLNKSGLGYAQIQQLIIFVNGKLSVDSQPNNGCRISIEFPILPDEFTNPYFNR
jgi:two-component system, sensor histidine kinase LadS